MALTVQGQIILEDMFSATLDDLQTGLEQSKKETEELGDELDDLGKATGLDPLLSDIDELQARAKAAAVTADKLGREFSEIPAQSRVDELTAQIGRLQAKARSGVKLSIGEISEYENLNGELTRLQRGLDGVTGKATVTTGIMQKLTKVAALAGLSFGAMQLGRAAWGMLEFGAATADARESFEDLARNSGVNAQQLISDMKDVSHGAVMEADLMKTANLAMMASGKDLADNLPRLYEGARLAAKATGEDVGHIYDTLIRGIVRGSPLLIDNANIFIKAGDSVERYAKSLGKTTEELSTTERMMATLNAVLAQIDKNLAGAGDSAATHSEQVASIGIAWDEAKAAMGEYAVEKGAADALGTAAMNIRSLAEGAYGATEEFEVMNKGIHATGLAIEQLLVGDTMLGLTTLGRAIASSFLTAEEEAKAVDLVLNDLGISLAQIEGLDMDNVAALVAQIAKISPQKAQEFADAIEEGGQQALYAAEVWHKLNKEIDNQVDVAIKFNPSSIEGYVNHLNALAAAQDRTTSAIRFTTDELREEHRAMLAASATTNDLSGSLEDVIRAANKPISIEAKTQGFEQSLARVEGGLVGLSDIVSSDELTATRAKVLAELKTLYTGMGDITDFEMQLIAGRYLDGWDDIISGTRSAHDKLLAGQKSHGVKMAASASSIQSAIEQALAGSVNVTAEDMALADAGLYEDKVLESARQLNAVAARGFAELDLHPDWYALFDVPEDVVKSWPEDELKAKAAQLSADIVDLVRPDKINWDAFIGEYQKIQERQAAKELTIDIAVDKLVASGALDKSTDEIRKDIAAQLGLELPTMTMDTLFAVESGTYANIQAQALEGNTAVVLPVELAYTPDEENLTKKLAAVDTDMETIMLAVEPVLGELDDLPTQTVTADLVLPKTLPELALIANLDLTLPDALPELSLVTALDLTLPDALPELALIANLTLVMPDELPELPDLTLDTDLNLVLPAILPSVTLAANLDLFLPDELPTLPDLTLITNLDLVLPEILPGVTLATDLDLALPESLPELALVAGIDLTLPDTLPELALVANLDLILPDELPEVPDLALGADVELTLPAVLPSLLLSAALDLQVPESLPELALVTNLDVVMPEVLPDTLPDLTIISNLDLVLPETLPELTLDAPLELALPDTLPKLALIANLELVLPEELPEMPDVTLAADLDPTLPEILPDVTLAAVLDLQVPEVLPELALVTNLDVILPEILPDTLPSVTLDTALDLTLPELLPELTLDTPLILTLPYVLPELALTANLDLVLPEEMPELPDMAIGADVDLTMPEVLPGVTLAAALDLQVPETLPELAMVTNLDIIFPETLPEQTVAAALAFPETLPELTLDTALDLELPDTLPELTLVAHLDLVLPEEMPVVDIGKADASNIEVQSNAPVALETATAITPDIDLDSIYDEGLSAADQFMGGFDSGLLDANPGSSIYAIIAGSIDSNEDEYMGIGTRLGTTISGAFSDAMEAGVGNIRQDMARIIAPEVAAILSRQQGGRGPID